MIIVYGWPPNIPSNIRGDEGRGISHVAISFTGLGKKSFYIDWDGGNTPDFYSVDFWYAYKHYGKAPIRIGIPTQEDGNPDGLSEEAAYKWWIDFKKTNSFNPATNDCSAVTIKALKNAGSEKYLQENHLFWSTEEAIQYAENLAKEILQKINEKGKKPIYGVVIEDYHSKVWKSGDLGKKHLDEEADRSTKMITHEDDPDTIEGKYKVHRQSYGAKFDPLFKPSNEVKKSEGKKIEKEKDKEDKKYSK